MPAFGLRGETMPMRTTIALWAFAAALAAAGAGPPSIAPGLDLVAEGIPPIPSTLAKRVRPYTEFRPQRLFSWHPERREMLIGRRALPGTVALDSKGIHGFPTYVQGYKAIRARALPEAARFEHQRISFRAHTS